MTIEMLRMLLGFIFGLIGFLTGAGFVCYGVNKKDEGLCWFGVVMMIIAAVVSTYTILTGIN